MVAVLLLLGLAVLGAAGVFMLRHWARRVERGPGDLPTKVHRLQRAATAAVLLVSLLPWLALLPSGAGSSGSGDRLRIVVVVLVPVLLIGLLFGVTRAVRPSLVRLRGIAAKSPLRWRRLIVLVPVGLAIGLLYALLRALVPATGAMHGIGRLLAYAVALIAAQALLAPLWLVAMRTRPLPPDQAARLEALALRLEVRVRSFRAYPGRSQKTANAVQVGLLPQLRYVLVSDYLLDHCTPEELDAIVAHELGHARGHHLLVKLGGVALTWGGVTGLVTAFGRSQTAGSLPVLLLPVALPVALLLVQGLLGVRLERRADAAAARQVGAPQLAAALDRLASLNHTQRRTGAVWNLLTQHPGIQQRIDVLNASASERPADALTPGR